MRIVPQGSMVVTNCGEFISLTPGAEVDLPDEIAARLVAGGNAVAVEPEPVAAPSMPADDVVDAEPAVPVKRPRSGKRIAAAPENK